MHARHPRHVTVPGRSLEVGGFLEDVWPGVTVRTVESIGEVSWADILLRRTCFVTKPLRAQAALRAKWEAAKFLGLVRCGQFAADSVRAALLHDGMGGGRSPVAFLSSTAFLHPFLRFHLSDDFAFTFLWPRFDGEQRKTCEECLRAESPRDDEGVSVFFNLEKLWFLEPYRAMHPRRRIVLRYFDMFDVLARQLPVHEIDAFGKYLADLTSRGIVDSVESYHRGEATRLGVLHRPNGVHVGRVRAVEPGVRDALFRFRGSDAEPERLRPLARFGEELRALCPYTGGWSEQRLMHTEKFLPYPEYLAQAMRAELCVDLWRLSPDEGFSYRIPEALALNRKIVTNREGIEEEPFFSPERVFRLGKDDPARLRDWLEAPLEPLAPELLRLYDSSLWWGPEDPLTAP